MRLDVRLDPILPPLVALLWGQIEDARRQLQELVAGMDQPALEYRGPTGDDNSTASLLAHLALSDLSFARHCFGTEIPVDVRARFGPNRDEAGRLPVVTGVPAAELLDRVDTAHGYLRRGMAGLQDTDLDRVLPLFRGNDGTLRWVLWHVADHHMLHQGQIRTLKRHLLTRG